VRDAGDGVLDPQGRELRVAPVVDARPGVLEMVGIGQPDNVESLLFQKRPDVLGHVPHAVAVGDLDAVPAEDRHLALAVEHEAAFPVERPPHVGQQGGHLRTLLRAAQVGVQGQRPAVVLPGFLEAPVLQPHVGRRELDEGLVLRVAGRLCGSLHPERAPGEGQVVLDAADLPARELGGLLEGLCRLLVALLQKQRVAHVVVQVIQIGLDHQGRLEILEGALVLAHLVERHGDPVVGPHVAGVDADGLVELLDRLAVAAPPLVVVPEEVVRVGVAQGRPDRAHEVVKPIPQGGPAGSLGFPGFHVTGEVVDETAAVDGHEQQGGGCNQDHACNLVHGPPP